jgi:hypothetical protein
VLSTKACVGDIGISQYIHGLTLNRSHTYALYCAACRVYVENPCEKGNAHGLHIDAMI